MAQFNSLKAGINSMVKESTKKTPSNRSPYDNQFSQESQDMRALGDKYIALIQKGDYKAAQELAKKLGNFDNPNTQEQKTDSAKPNKGAIINTVGDTVAESIPNAPKKDNSMPVPRRN